MHEKKEPSDYTNEDNYRVSYLPTQSIATSTGQNDAGVFELNFRDERYLPFEGAGVISRWRFKLPNNFKPFDYDTISDVILHFRYTARDGGDLLRNKAVENLTAFIKRASASGTVRLFSVRHEFPSEWTKFKNATNVFAGLTLNLQPEHYPFWSKGRLGAVKSAGLYAKTSESSVEVTENGDGTGKKDTLRTRLGNLVTGPLTKNQPQSPTGNLTLYFNDKSMEDLWLVLAWGK